MPMAIAEKVSHKGGGTRIGLGWSLMRLCEISAIRLDLGG